MTPATRWTFEYAGLPDEGATEPPYVWFDLQGPDETLDYPCLLDSGSSFSLFPLTVADELGVPQELLEETQVRTAGGLRDALHLRKADAMAVLVAPDVPIPIAPYFFSLEIVEAGLAEADLHVLGRDFFLPFYVTFDQVGETVTLELRDGP